MDKLESRMLLQPSLNFFAFVHPQVVQNNMNRRLRRRNRSVKLFQKDDEFLLPLAFGSVAINFSRTRIKTCK